MFTQSQTFLNDQFRLLAQGQIETVAHRFAPTAVVAYADSQVILRGVNQTTDYLRKHLAFCNSVGIISMSPKVLSVNVHRGIRFKAVVETTCALADTRQTYVALAEYGFLKIGGGGLRIEMVQCAKPSLEAMATEIRHLKISA